MVRLVQRDALAGAADLRQSAALGSGPTDPAEAAVSLSPERLDAAERERRSHIRRWAAMMITHLERSEFDDARHYGYEEALERLQALIARELDEVRGTRSPES